MLHIENIENICRTEPANPVLYRMKYCCDIASSRGTVRIFFVVESNPLGTRTVYWDTEPKNLTTTEKSQVLQILQSHADNGKLPC